jgi:hypothetical protein
MLALYSPATSAMALVHIALVCCSSVSLVAVGAGDEAAVGAEAHA